MEGTLDQYTKIAAYFLAWIVLLSIFFATVIQGVLLQTFGGMVLLSVAYYIIAFASWTIGYVCYKRLREKSRILQLQ